MPKLKVLETRQTPDEVVIMSWSPRMDLLALGNNKGEVMLHRLNWQKVWQVTLTIKEEPVVPELMAWHPEGLFLVATSGEMTFVIDIESGKIVHNHEISFRVTAVRWCSSKYEHCFREGLPSQFRYQVVQRFESNLSILFLGTENGYVYGYTGGFLLGLCMRIPEEGDDEEEEEDEEDNEGDHEEEPTVSQKVKILQADATQDLQSFFFIIEECAEESESTSSKKDTEVGIMFTQLTNTMLPEMAPIIRPLGLRYIVFLKNWATVQAEFTNLGEAWERVVELYETYMTFGGTKDIEEARVDYLELALTGISSVEMEIFLGAAGREKEAKKNINALNSTAASIVEHIRTIKCSLTNMLTELNEIGGFLRHISKCDEAEPILIETRKAVMCFYLAILNLQGLLHNFVEVCLNFMNLVLNTIHTFNIQDPEFVDEDCDTDKVLEFLQSKVDEDILDYLFTHVKLGYTEEKEKNKKRNFNLSLTLPSFENSISNITNPDGGDNCYQDFANLVHGILKKSSCYPDGHPLLLDYSEPQVKELVKNIVPTVNSLTKRLLCIPVLCSVPFEAHTFPIIRLPSKSYFSDEERRVTKPFCMHLSESTSNIYLSKLVDSNKILVFAVNLLEPEDQDDFFAPLHDEDDDDEPWHPSIVQLKSTMFIVSHDVWDIDIFSEHHLTIISYDDTARNANDGTTGRTIVCQIPYASLLANVPGVEVPNMEKGSGVEPGVPEVVKIDIPTDIPQAGPGPFPSSNIDYLLPVESFCPSMVKVSGGRKVGSLLGKDKRSVTILEMEMDADEDSTMDGDEEQEQNDKEERRDDSDNEEEEDT